MFMAGDVAHSEPAFSIQFRTLDDFRCLGPKGNLPGVLACGYMVSMEIPYCRGRIVWRMDTGELVCYDLSATKK